MAGLKPSHAKKLRRYSRKPAMYGYRITAEPARKISASRIQRCYDLLCETMANNSDSDVYTRQSFEAHMRSLPFGVLLATHADGRVLGFCSGAVIGHDHATEFRTWNVYHNLVMELAKREFKRGAALVDLANTNGTFKQQLGGRTQMVSFELRSGVSMQSALGLGCWALGSMVPEDHLLRRATAGWDRRLLALLALAALALLALALRLLQRALPFRLLDLALLLGLVPMLLARLQRARGA